MTWPNYGGNVSINGLVTSPSDPETVAQDVILMLLGIANAASSLSYGAGAQNAAAVDYALTKKPTSVEATAFPFTPVVYEPNVYIPERADTDVRMAQIEPLIQNMMSSLEAEFTRFFDTYFPIECDYLGKAQAWICNVITNNGIGIDAATEDMIYQRDRDRIESEYLAKSAAAESRFASRGFAMPGAMLLAQQSEARLEADKGLNESSRNAAIKHLELRVDTVKFAVDKALDLRLKAVQAAAGYLQALTGGLDVYSKSLVVIQDAQAKLIAAGAEFYRARIAVEELKFKADQFEADLQDKAAQRYHEQLMRLADHANTAMVDGAKTLASQASAALNALHTGANISYGVNQ